MAVEESVKLSLPFAWLLPRDRRLNIEDTGRRKLRNVAELLLQVKNFFLQMQDFSRGRFWQLHAIFRGLQLASQTGLAQPGPPVLRDGQTVRRLLLQKPG